MAVLRIVILLLCLATSAVSRAELLFQRHSFTEHDAVYVVDQSGQSLYQWQIGKALVPASLTKLVTTYLALDKWGAEHRFETDIYQLNDQLWIKGLGDPYLISEELDSLAAELQRVGVSPETIRSIWLDNSYFKTESVPGRSTVTDPYNAPLSAIAANFNTVQLRRVKGRVESAEQQTPLTSTGIKLAGGIGPKTQRVNLRTVDNAQHHFAEILVQKMGLEGITIHINQTLPPEATLLYRHYNSRTLEDDLRATLEYSNNFIANQLYLKLAEAPSVQQLSFAAANNYSQRRLEQLFKWRQAALFDGSGLSRTNRLTAQQLDQVLARLQANKALLSRVPSSVEQAQIYAKTGTLDGVRSYAGFIDLPSQSYRFVFVFNRQVAYGYRDKLLRELVFQLASKS